MSDSKNNANNDEKDISLLKELIHKKRDETEALKNLFKALEEDGIKTNLNPKTTDKGDYKK